MFIVKFMVPSPKDETKTDVYRWVFNEVLENLKRGRLIEKLRDLFGPNKKFYISWFDGADYCSIVDDETLTDAARSSLKSCPSHNTMRFYVTFDKREASTIFGDCPKDDNDDDNEQNASDTDADTTNDESIVVVPEEKEDKKSDSNDEGLKSETEDDKEEKKKLEDKEEEKKQEDEEKNKQQEPPKVVPSAQVYPGPMLPQNVMPIPSYHGHPSMFYPVPMYMPMPVPQYTPVKPQTPTSNVKTKAPKKEKK